MTMIAANDNQKATGKFVAGQTYATRSICDYDCIVSVTVAKRTAKTITTTEGKRFRIKLNYDGVESIMPWGSYSMCPMITANDPSTLNKTRHA